jgi:hypothetical protein
MKNTEREIFTAEYRREMRELVRDFCNKIPEKAINETKQFALFWPVIGRDYLKEDIKLLIIGRATNGWGEKDDNIWFNQKAMDETEIETIIQGSFNYIQTEKNDCPFDWIKDPKYKMTRSAFWRVVKEVIMSFYNKSENDCYYPIAWSEMCKIAPAEGKNPNARETDIQWNKCMELISLEIKMLKPKNVLFMTGWEWAKYYFEKEHIKTTYKSRKPAGVEATGDAFGANIIVAPHPERKKQDPIVKAIKESLVI